MQKEKAVRKTEIPASNVDFQRPGRTGQPVTPVREVGHYGDIRTWKSASHYEIGGKEEEPQKDTVEISDAARRAYRRMKEDERQGDGGR